MAFTIIVVASLLFAMPQADMSSAQVFDENGENVIKIGTLLTDSSAHQDRLTSMMIAQEDFNNSQDDYTLELVPFQLIGESDSHADSRTGIKIKEAFDTENITYFVGPMGSTDTTSAKAQLELLEDANPGTDFIVISPASTSPTLRDDDSVFRMTIDDTQQTVKIAERLYSDGKTHIVMLGLNSYHPEQVEEERDIWSKGLEDGLYANFKGTIAEHITITIYDDEENAPSAAVYDTQVLQLNQKVSMLISEHGVDNVAVVIMAYGDDIIQLVQAINRNPDLDSLDDIQWYGPDGIAARDEVVSSDPNVGTFLADVQFQASQYAGETNSIKTDVENKLKNRGVVSTDSIYLYSSYDAVTLLANAIAQKDQRNDETTVKMLLPELADDGSIGIGTLGDYSFNDAGDLDAPLSYTFWRIVLDSNSAPVWTNVAPVASMTCR